MAQHLRAWIAYSGRNVELFTWRTRSNVEVDLVLYGSGGFWAIEVMNPGEVRPADLRSLNAFRDDYPEAEALLLYRGNRRMRKGEVRCVPVAEALAGLTPSGDLTP